MSATHEANISEVARVHYMIGTQRTLVEGPLALVVSDFDGAHTGHLAMARRGAALAEERGARLVALLPWPSPAGGDNVSAPRLTTLDERIARLRKWELFADIVVMPPPAEPREAEAAVAALRALGDVRALVCEAEPIGAARALVGPMTLAHAAAAEITAEAFAFPPTHPDGEHQAEVQKPLGSWVARLVEDGRMAEATAVLGYAYTVAGEVIGGDRRGRLLGFPTANLRPDSSKIIPNNGVYAALVGLPGEAVPSHPAAVSIGVRPTFGEGNRRQIEAFLLDASLDLYGLWIAVQFVAFLRPELRFDSVEALIDQMEHDCEQTRRLLGVK